MDPITNGAKLLYSTAESLYLPCPQCGCTSPHGLGTDAGPHAEALAKAKCAIIDLLDALFHHDVRRGVTMSRRIQRLCPWLKGV